MGAPCTGVSCQVSDREKKFTEALKGGKKEANLLATQPTTQEYFSVLFFALRD